jgi:dihydrofolate synthase / folylpolyglutamate synthase
MQLIPIKTRVLLPPHDDLFAALDESLTDVLPGDIIVVSSKVVSIHEGRCVPIDGTDRAALIESEADVLIPREYWPSPLTVTRHAFIGTAGIDESNGAGYYVLLPKDSFASAQALYTYLSKRFETQSIGVVITDSHSSPFRRGATGISIGFHGFAPMINHVGSLDLFDRPFKIEVTNLVDGIAAAANVVMGETNECQPVVIARGVPNLYFTEEDFREEFLVSPQDDTFRVLYERFLS